MMTEEGRAIYEAKLRQHQTAEPMLQFFAFNHLPVHLQEVSIIYFAAAMATMDEVPRNPERTVALRKLLEAKDAAVRARLYKMPEPVSA